ncbi:hypothetical protein KDRO_A04460 [Kluyveromyces lactis]|nr:hypothetical protein KDRO_A04460 [Kluyveromyces lactis]
MVRFYCWYCKSYLTHDTASVRKSHLLGKNHIRLVADYYRNIFLIDESKKLKRTKNRKPRKKEVTEPRNVPRCVMHCPTNRRKRMMKMTKNKDTLDDFDVLDAIYKGSPGYERIFRPENRIDIGHLLKVSKQPQRGNVNRNSVAKPTLNESTSILPPPRTLAWNNTYSMKFHDPSLLQNSINHTVKQLKK